MINEPEINELEPELLGLHSLNFSAAHNSSSRGVMFASHFSQRLVTVDMDEKRILTGVEQEFGKYTFSIKMPADGQIIQIIQRYPQGIEQGSLNYNPETIVIYENDQTKEIDYFAIPKYASFHQFFGFKYDIKEDKVSLLRPNANIKKGTIFADTPGATPNTGYKYGNNFNIAFMSIPSVSEDGVMICEDILPRMAFRIYERRVAECGAGQFPLNLYGTPNRYQPTPEIGDMIREDGLLAMFRTYDPDLAPVEMSIYDTMEPDFIFDKGVYARGGQGRVVDVKVISNNNPSRMLPPLMAQQFDKYWKALLKYHQTIIDAETRLKYERKRKFGEAKLKLSPKLHRLIVESLALTNYNATKMKHSLNLLFRKAPIDEYRIEFVIEYVMIPTVGYKISDQAGGLTTNVRNIE